jgi:uncharacterized tellurite resistance protein B-like protein
MLEYLRKLFSDNEASANTSVDKPESDKNNRKVEIAACALFIEMAKSDGEYSDDEKEFIITEMKSVFNISDEYVSDLIHLAEQRVKESVSLYEFTGVINTTFTHNEKIELMESLWRLIYKDKKLSAYEDHLIKKIGATINIEHKEIINSKLLVKEQIGLR